MLSLLVASSLLFQMGHSYSLVGRGARDPRPQCTELVECDHSWAAAFLPTVEVQCYRDPALIDRDPCVRVRVRTMVDYEIVDSDQYVYIVLPTEPSYVAGEVIYEQREGGVNVNEPVGIALDGVLVYAGAVRDGEDALSTGGERIDRCGGTLSADSDALYHYRAPPACILGAGGLDTADLRRTFVADVHELLDSFEPFRGRHSLGYGLDGHPIYSPFTERGLLQSQLDNCNGKVVNGSYGYYSTPWFPYTIGCFGPGVYPLDETEQSLGSTHRGASSACPGGSQYSARSNGCELCPAGTYSVSAYTVGAACSGVCPVGHYCPPGSAAPAPCPRGRFGSALGERHPSCSGPCAAGHWCPEASWRPDAVPCGNASYFCPPESGFPRTVLPAFYSTPEGAALRSGQAVCEPGHYCLDGVRHACPAGVYGETQGLTDASCTAACPVGYYCPAGSEVPVPCPAGRYGAEEGLSAPECSGPCDRGHWCPLASSTPQARRCPGGRFGPTEGLRTSHCSASCEPPAVLADQGKDQLPARLHQGGQYRTSAGLSEDLLPNPACVYNFCKEGYYCPEASSSATQRECGAASVFCPTGSETPTPVSPGHYTTGLLSRRGEMQDRADASTRTWQAPCESGFHCSRGVKRRCPAGRFGAHPAEPAPACSGPCDEGFFCREGSALRKQNPCGSPAVYCPLGSAAPLTVPAGFYSVNGTDSTRSAIVACPPGHYCVGGIKRPCAAGRYSVAGSPSAECDGLCDAGFYCPVASSSAKERSCPAGRYGHKGMTDDSCLGICARGYFCPLNSTSPQQYECGGEYVYCPVGSAYPLEVDYGHYSSGGTVTTRFAQLRCEFESPVRGTPPAAEERVNICPETTQWRESGSAAR